jgi:hypothetical protein
MKNTVARRSAVVVAGLFAFTPLLLKAGNAPFKTEYFTGTVQPLAGVLKKASIQLDPDASATWLALVTPDGRTYPLIKDSGSRMFFKDKRLLGRPMRLTGKLFGGTNLLQVVNVHSLRDGVLHDVYYWCEVCTIRAYEDKICECCGAPMELREVASK